MKLGFFTMPIHPLDKDWRQSLREDREAFLLADKLGFTEGLCRRALDRPRREHHLLHGVHRQPDPRHQDHQARHRHRQHAEPASGGGRGQHRDARPHARRPFHLRHQPGRLAVRRGGVRRARRRPQCDVPRGDQHRAGDLAARAALQHRGQILERQDRTPVHAGDRSGLPAEAVAEAASADRGDGRRAVLEGRDRGRCARLGSDLGELPDAGMGEKPLAEIRRRLPARGTPGRSGKLARRQKHLRRRRRQDRGGLCQRSRAVRTATITASSTPS